MRIPEMQNSVLVFTDGYETCIIEVHREMAEGQSFKVSDMPARSLLRGFVPRAPTQTQIKHARRLSPHCGRMRRYFQKPFNAHMPV